MKKRFLIVLTILVFLLCTSLILAACDENTVVPDNGNTTPTSPDNGDSDIIPDPSDTHNHTYSSDWTTDATYHWHAATCGHDVVQDKAQHTWDGGAVTLDATETSEGERIYICTVCGATKAETIDKLPHVHTYADTWTSDDTYHWHAATCGHNVVQDKAKHSWDSGTVTLDATETREGERTYTCTVCGATKAETIDKLPHVHTYADTWTSDDTSHWHVATCGHDVVQDKAQHNWDGGTETTAASEDAAGIMTYNCTICGATKTVGIYLAVFVADDNTIETVKYMDGYTTLSSIPAVPEKVGFIGEWEPYSLAIGGTTINAYYTPILYCIAYKDTKQCTNPNPIEYTIQSDTITLASIECEGYQFDGWFNQDGAQQNEIIKGTYGDIELTAHWTPIQYTATFVADGVTQGTCTFTIEDTTLSNIPTVPSKTGYTGSWSQYIIAPHDIEISAVYSINHYTVTWENHDGTILEIDTEVEYNTIPSFGSATPTKPRDTYYEYTFSGWLPAVEAISEDSVFIAQFTQQESTNYIVSYDANGGDGTPGQQTKTKGNNLILSTTVPSKPNKVFLGWQSAFSDSIYKAGATFNVDANTTLYAVWGHTCSDCNGTGQEDTRSSCTYCNANGTITQTSSCHTCGGKGTRKYCSNCKKYDVAVRVIDYFGSVCNSCYNNGLWGTVSTVTCTACNGKGKWTVTSQCTNCGGDGIIGSLHACPTCKGEKGLNDEHVTSSVSLYVNNTVFAKANVFMDSPYKLSIPTKSGYDFLGWFDAKEGGKQYTDSFGVGMSVWNVEGNKALYAHWSLCVYSINYLNATAPLIDALPQSYTVEDAVIILPPQDREYYTFKWTLDAATITCIDTSLAKDLIITANWTPIIYGITYNTGGGTNNVDNPATYTVESNTITFADATRTGYTFGGWYTDVECTQPISIINTGSNGNVAVYAKWVVIAYDIHYHLYGGTNSVGNPATYTVEDSVTFADATRNYYTFSGWYTDATLTSQKTTISKGCTEDVTLFAKWTPIAYTIGYTMNGGTASNIATYTVETASFTLENPTRTGYTFLGWTGSNGDDPDKDVTIDEGTNGNLQYVANWQINEYTLRFETNGGSSVGPITQEYNTSLTLPKSSLEEKSFVGWFDQSLTTEYSLSKMPAADLTLYAKWIDYEIALTYTARETVSVFEQLSIESFDASAIDTDGNSIDVTIQLIGNQEAGNEISVRLIATGLYGVYTVKTIMGIKLYGLPVISYDAGKDYINLSDAITPALFAASAVDSFNETIPVSINIIEGTYHGGDMVSIILSTTDVTGNSSMVTIEDIKVYGAPTIIRDTSITGIKVSDAINSALFGVTATDSFGEVLDVSTALDVGTISAGYTITIKSTTMDSKGNTTTSTYPIQVYGLPTISEANKTSFKVEDDITLSSLGIVATDSFGTELTNVSLRLTFGEQTAGSTLTYLVTATDYLGNFNTREIEGIRIYGTPSITYNTDMCAIKATDVVNSALFDATATDSFGDELNVDVVLNSGVFAGGNTVTFNLSATDVLGNLYQVVTPTIKVYSSDSITLTYTTGATNIRKASVGEEFNATATDGFGEECNTSIIAADGYELVGGSTVNLYIVATDVMGNTTKSELITGIKIYDMPTLQYARDYDYIQKGDSPYALFQVLDSFNKELLFDVETISGSLDVNESITYRITAKDKAKNELVQDYTLAVLDTDESILEMYYNEQFIGFKRIYKGEDYSLRCDTGYMAVWYLGEVAITEDTGIALTVWNYPSNGYIVNSNSVPIIYNLYYILDGGTNSSLNPLTYSIEDEDICFDAPTKNGYTFVSWYSDFELTQSIASINAGSIGDKTIFAKWQINIYSIQYYLDGGINDETNPSTYSVVDIVNLASPTRQHYDFGGWYLDSCLSSPVSTIVDIVGDICLYAKWETVEYTITYQLNGGSNSSENPASYTINTIGEGINLADATKIVNRTYIRFETLENGNFNIYYSTTSYTFLGWYREIDYINQIEEISLLDGNIMLFAKWSIGTTVETTVEESAYVLQGDMVYFGTYPQSQVSDSTIKTSLRQAAGSLPSAEDSRLWTSFCYTTKMWYIDLVYEGEKYRGVYFTGYRDSYSQKRNGYNEGTVYWFKYEPIKWQIIYKRNGRALLFCDVILDTQKFNSTWTGEYANVYSTSTLNEWLNTTFSDSAFSAYQEGFCYGDVTLLSDSQASSQQYGFDSLNTFDDMRIKYASDYSLCQGLYAYDGAISSNKKLGEWWTQSAAPGDSAAYAYLFDHRGLRIAESVTLLRGVVPALYINLN